MSETIGTINLDKTSTVTWPTASGYTNCINPETPSKPANPSDQIMNDLGVHFYRLAQTNYTEDHWFDTKVIDRMADFNVCVILDLLHVWSLWRKRNNKADNYYVFDHLDDFEEAIEQAVTRIQPHITNKKKLWVNVWNEPDWWLDGFWKGDEQQFKDTWRTAYNKLRSVLLSEQKILGPALSGFYKPQLKRILKWMDNENLLPDHISYHYPFENVEEQSYTIQSWGYEQTIYIGEYLPPVCDPTGSCKKEDNPTRSFGYPGKFVHQIAAFTYGHITGGGLDPTGKWNIGGLKGMDGLIAERGTDKLTNLGYVCKLYTQATSVNNRPVACVLNKTDAGNTKIFATRRYDKTHILMGTYEKDPLITELALNNAEDYYHKVTLWIIPFSTKNNPCDESDLIKYNMGSSRPESGTLTIDVTAWSDWSERENGSKNDACYIEVEKVIPPLYVSIDGPTEVPANAFSFWTADAHGGLPYYEYTWKIREHHEGTGWDEWNDYGAGRQQSYAPPGNIDMFEWKVTVTDADNNTAHYDLIVTVVPRI